MNTGVLITAIVMLAIMCSPIFFFRNKGKKKDKKPSPKPLPRGGGEKGSCLLREESLPPRGEVGGGLFRWRWSILLISVFLSVADYVYFYSLSLDGALISVVSMVRRSSVLVSFMLGALLFHEKNLRSKAIDLALVLLSMMLLWLGQ